MGGRHTAAEQVWTEGHLWTQTEIFPWYTSQIIWVPYHKYQNLFAACVKEEKDQVYQTPPTDLAS